MKRKKMSGRVGVGGMHTDKAAAFEITLRLL